MPSTLGTLICVYPNTTGPGKIRVSVYDWDVYDPMKMQIVIVTFFYDGHDESSHEHRNRHDNHNSRNYRMNRTLTYSYYPTAEFSGIVQNPKLQ